MKDGLSDLLPSRAIARRMHELETELERARAYRRQHSKSPETLGRWGLEQPPVPQQEEGWFITYLDMMTLLLVVMIVMLAFSGNLTGEDSAASPVPVTEPVTEPAPSELITPAGPSPQSGDGLQPAGSGLFPEQAVPDTAMLSEPLPGWTAPWDLPELPAQPDEDMALSAATKATAPASPPSLPLSGLSHLYPGFSSADLAASFIGPPRPGVTATASVTPDTSLSENTAPPAGLDLPSEGETLAAGLSLGELGSDVEVLISERSVSFRVNSEILFDSSQADLSRSGLAVLRRIVRVLSDTNHVITVEGHTDSVAVRRNVRFPSNWELSSARAGSVVRYLQANGIERHRLKAVGYADTRPIADNHTPDGRAANRRVELLIEKRD